MNSERKRRDRGREVGDAEPPRRQEDEGHRRGAGRDGDEIGAKWKIADGQPRQRAAQEGTSSGYPDGCATPRVRAAVRNSAVSPTRMSLAAVAV